MEFAPRRTRILRAIGLPALILLAAAASPSAAQELDPIVGYRLVGNSPLAELRTGSAVGESSLPLEDGVGHIQVGGRLRKPTTLATALFLDMGFSWSTGVNRDIPGAPATSAGTTRPTRLDFSEQGVFLAAGVSTGPAEFALHYRTGRADLDLAVDRDGRTGGIAADGDRRSYGLSLGWNLGHVASIGAELVVSRLDLPDAPAQRPSLAVAADGGVPGYLSLGDHENTSWGVRMQVDLLALSYLVQ